MLRTRIITAAVLLAVLLPSLFFAPAFVFASVAGIFGCAGMWEWARLAGQKPAAALTWAALWLIAAAGVLSRMTLGSKLNLGLDWAFIAAALTWAVLLASSLPGAALPRLLAVPHILAFLGFVVMFAAWLALLQARQAGAGFLLSVLLVAWVADVAAYFGGRAFGRRKLAPRISPGKTWAGVYAALLAVLAYGLLCSQVPALSNTLLARIDRMFGLAAMLGCAALFLALSIMGDLFESLLKRHAGVKDSSALLPGHGGVLDRIDALLPLLPVAILFLA